MTEDIRDALNAYVGEALQLRFAGDLLKPGADTSLVQGSLMDLRQRLDRVEELLGRTIRIRGRVRRAADVAEATANDAWDRAARAARTAPVIRGDEYSSAKERHAEANLTVFTERRAARAAGELAHISDEAVDVLRLTLRGLEGARHDHLAVLRALQTESFMDR